MGCGCKNKKRKLTEGKKTTIKETKSSEKNDINLLNEIKRINELNSLV